MGSWVTMMTVWPSSRTEVRSKERTSAPVVESRLPVGSSPNTTSGRVRSARATATRCCCPPESWWGLWVRRSVRASEVVISSNQVRSTARPARSSGRRMFCSAVRVGTRL